MSACSQYIGKLGFLLPLELAPKANILAWQQVYLPQRKKKYKGVSKGGSHYSWGNNQGKGRGGFFFTVLVLDLHLQWFWNLSSSCKIQWYIKSFLILHKETLHYIKGTIHLPWVEKRRQCRAGSTCRRIQQPDRILRSRHTTCTRVKLNYTKGKNPLPWVEKRRQCRAGLTCRRIQQPE